MLRQQFLLKHQLHKLRLPPLAKTERPIRQQLVDHFSAYTTEAKAATHRGQVFSYQYPPDGVPIDTLRGKLSEEFVKQLNHQEKLIFNYRHNARN
jgi:hypothetical protein